MNYPGAAGAAVNVTSNVSGIALQRGESHYLFGVLKAGATQLPINDGNVAVEPAAGMAAVQASISVNIQSQQEGPVAAVAIEVDFDAAPGAGESIAIQEADTDADDWYITPSAAAYTISTFNANNNARSDLFTTGGKFLRVVRTKGANNAGIIVRATRLA